jgi:predicted DNA-binding ribbon-helix-helix protein
VKEAVQTVRFRNLDQKRRFVLEHIAVGEKVTLHTLSKRLAASGYHTSVQELAQFIRYHMLYRYLKVEKGEHGINLYRRL